ncbi:unnamed protein product [Cyclocybe aegerita]|uniref:MARVEL domain-containing protein n=1 Tax=Cyclocybe aegerita TaxID=1973307 RepID=A0A8S0WIE0_CYCAE|nr:unnamed protein product [Cyclocybe aegerita]
MDSATPFTSSTIGGPGVRPRSKLKKTLDMFAKQWPYIGFCILLAVLNILLGILMLSYLKPKEEPLIFGIMCLSVVLSLGHFAALCYLIQRAKNESSDPTMIDVLYTIGVVALFAISGAALTVELPNKCYNTQQEDYRLIGQAICDGITAMAASSWLAVLTMIIASILTFVAARRAIELAKLPPPVFPEGAQAPVMRWLDRNDPFLSIRERQQDYA